MTTLVYVAASSQEILRARDAIDQVRAVGLEVTCDWVETIQKTGGDPNPYDVCRERCRGWAQEDLDGVTRANIVWLLYPQAGAARGAFAEFGAALALRKLTVVSGEGQAGSIFTALADFCVDDDRAAVGTLLRLHRWRIQERRARQS